MTNNNSFDFAAIANMMSTFAAMASAFSGNASAASAPVAEEAKPEYKKFQVYEMNRERSARNVYVVDSATEFKDKDGFSRVRFTFRKKDQSADIAKKVGDANHEFCIVFANGTLGKTKNFKGLKVAFSGVHKAKFVECKDKEGNVITTKNGEVCTYAQQNAEAFVLVK